MPVIHNANTFRIEFVLQESLDLPPIISRFTFDGELSKIPDDDDLTNHFSKFGQVETLACDRLTGCGTVEFNNVDLDHQDMVIGQHNVNGTRVNVKRAYEVRV